MTKEEELTQYCSEFNCPDYSNCDLCMYNKGKADAIEEVINNCSKEYQASSDDTVCKIWLSKLEQLKEQNMK